MQYELKEKIVMLLGACLSSLLFLSRAEAAGVDTAPPAVAVHKAMNCRMCQSLSEYMEELRLQNQNVHDPDVAQQILNIYDLLVAEGCYDRCPMPE